MLVEHIVLLLGVEMGRTMARLVRARYISNAGVLGMMALPLVVVVYGRRVSVTLLRVLRNSNSNSNSNSVHCGACGRPFLGSMGSNTSPDSGCLMVLFLRSARHRQRREVDIGARLVVLHRPLRICQWYEPANQSGSWCCKRAGLTVFVGGN